MDTAAAWGATADDYNKHVTDYTSLFCDNGLTFSGFGQQEGTVKILDIAAGSGSFALQAAKRLQSLGRNGEILATDFAEEMVQKMDINVKEQGFDKIITTKVMDGQNLLLEDSSFDLAASFFGLIFFPDRHKGLTEIKRVLKPNGKVIIGTWNVFPMDIFRPVMKLFPDVTPKLPSMNTIESVEKELAEAGFSDVTVYPVTHSWVNTHEAVLELAMSNPIFAQMSGSVGSKDEFVEMLRKVISEAHPKQFVVTTGTALVGIGTKK
eukprot:TRINITY_DN200_c0_g1_i1.p1 TRINITY_DN200_c0_g1~~TRINITY_DN200_c0_g1_i1.p1  ORF type:complete len:265 (-),score=56.86 TRINITY_DN200_c0_g1_i1:59-853(-)